MKWTKVTKILLDRQPDWIFQPLWIARNGVVYFGSYVWRQGADPDRFHCHDGLDLHALDNCHIMPLVKPVPPASETDNAESENKPALNGVLSASAKSSASDPYAPGTPCTVNTSGDMYMNADARPFFNAPCLIVKRTKAGLIQVSLADNPKSTYSFPQCNVDLAAPVVE